MAIRRRRPGSRQPRLSPTNSIESAIRQLEQFDAELLRSQQVTVSPTRSAMPTVSPSNSISPSATPSLSGTDSFGPGPGDVVDHEPPTASLPPTVVGRCVIPRCGRPTVPGLRLCRGHADEVQAALDASVKEPARETTGRAIRLRTDTTEK